MANDTALYRFAIAALGAWFFVVPARADDGRWTFSSGADYTSGRYGEAQTTTIVTVPLTASYATDRWSAALTIPLVSVDGPGTVVPGGTGGDGTLGGLLDGANAASPLSPPGGVNAMGLGDISLAFSVVPVTTADGFQMTATGRVKAPTADAHRALGTGDTEASLAGAVRQTIGTRAAIYGSLGYEHAFDSGANGAFGGVGAESYIAERLQLGAALDYAQADSQLRRNSTQATAYLGFDASATTKILAYGSVGLTETSPDLGAGIRIVFSPQ